LITVIASLKAGLSDFEIKPLNTVTTTRHSAPGGAGIVVDVVTVIARFAIINATVTAQL
jgi:hypothetical protein